MTATECGRRSRKEWATRAAAKLNGHRRHRYPESPPPQRTGTQAYTSDAEAASPDELAERRALAQPSRRATAQERRDQFVEAMVYPWAYGVCLRADSIRESRVFQDHVELLTAHAECGPHYEDEHKRLAAVADEIFDEAESINAFTVVCQRLEAMNAREYDTGRHTDEYVAAELRLYGLTGEWELNLTGDELYNLVQEVEGDLAAFDLALRKPV